MFGRTILEYVILDANAWPPIGRFETNNEFVVSQPYGAVILEDSEITGDAFSNRYLLVVIYFFTRPFFS